MWNGLIKKIRQLCSVVNSYIESVSAFLHIIIIFIVIIVCSQTIAFSSVYLQLLNEKEINMLCFQYINIWNILPSENITNEVIYSNFDTVKTRIEFLMNASIALSGMLLSLVTFISYFRKNIEFRKKSCFRKKEIFNIGQDDVKIMCEYFKGANFVAVYSHSFEWINKSNEMRKILTELSNKNKLKLYTGDDVDNVTARLKNNCEDNLIKCFQKSEVSLRFSYIERNNAKYLLYRQEEENHIYVISMHENNESQYLLQVISQLVK